MKKYTIDDPIQFLKSYAEDLYRFLNRYPLTEPDVHRWYFGACDLLFSKGAIDRKTMDNLFKEFEERTTDGKNKTKETDA